MMRTLAGRLKQIVAGRHKQAAALASLSMQDGGVPELPTSEPLLKDRVALVIGAGPNIGSHIASELAANGAVVHFTDLDRDWVATLQAKLQGVQPRCTGLVSDIASDNDRRQLLDHLEARGERPDLIVNNVGNENGPQRFPHFDLSSARSHFETNLLGPLELTSRLTRLMIEAGRPGSVLFTSSIHQDVLHRHKVVYSACKSALKMVVRELAYDLSPHGIRVNGIAPGYVASAPEEHRSTPLYHRPVAPEQIARTAVALASDYFSLKTTGAVLTIDGGLSLHSYLTNV